MIISKSRNFVFVHIPKNAGTTVESVLLPHLDPQRDIHVSMNAGTTPNLAAAGIDPDTRMTKHMTAGEIIRALTPKVYRGHFSFAVSRNPYSRCLSAFSFIRQKATEMKNGRAIPNAAQRDLGRFVDLSFDDFCADLPAAGAYLRLFRPQVTWLPKPNSVTYVARLESLAQDMGHVFGQIGLGQREAVAMPTRNKKTASGDWRAMSPAAAAAIRSYYAADFDRFGYDTAFPTGAAADAADSRGGAA